MGKPVMFKTPSGERMVILSLADYEALTAGPAEDAADVAAFDGAMASLGSGKERSLTPDEMASFYDRPGFLRGLRKGAEMTQADLAAKAGIGQSVLSEIEAGRRKPSPDTRAKIWGALTGR